MWGFYENYIYSLSPCRFLSVAWCGRAGGSALAKDLEAPLSRCKEKGEEGRAHGI